ncbi:MAG: alanine racemase [Proteobacteria bacterium]|nr:MAG: alanine racemase [Pseudomonadota bacterium]
MTRAAEALIDLAALAHNLARARQAAPGSRTMAVVKANGYGHGVERVAGALRTADAFAVACLDEALPLREAGFAHPINVLEGFYNTEELVQFGRHHIDATVHQPEQIEMLGRARLDHPLRVWLKIDSGMHRLGVAPETAAECWARLRACRSVGAIGLMTHLANADDRSDPMTEHQLKVFAGAVGRLQGERSIVNSAGILAWPAAVSDWIRPGIMLYGASPFAVTSATDEGLRSVMTLRTRLIAIRDVNSGDSVGYGASWRAARKSRIGVAAIGYGDGYPRHAPSGTPVLVDGKRAVLAGRVSMDMITLDLTAVPNARIGDPVVLWGEGLPVEEIALAAETIPYELFCQITPRVHFRELGS